MTKRKTSKLSYVLSYIFVILLIVLMCGFAVYFTNGFTTDFASFYVRIDGHDVLQNEYGVAVSYGNTLVIDIKYTMGFVNKDLGGYSFEIKANPDVDFDFKVGDDIFSFQGEADWTKCFVIEQGDTQLSLTPQASYISRLIKLAFSSDEVSLLGDMKEYSEKDLFLLTIYSYNKQAHITLGLNFGNDAEHIVLDKTEIVF